MMLPNSSELTNVYNAAHTLHFNVLVVVTLPHNLFGRCYSLTAVSHSHCFYVPRQLGKLNINSDARCTEPLESITLLSHRVELSDRCQLIQCNTQGPFGTFKNRLYLCSVLTV